MSRARGAKAQRRLVQQHTTLVPNTIDFRQAQRQSNTIELIPKSRGQEQLVLDLLDPALSVVVAVGPAGTGKTYLAMQAAVRALKHRTVDRLILTRPAIGVEDERHGFLPGDLVSKMEPWTRPLLDVLKEYYHGRDIMRMIEDGTIEISPLAYMRGRTFKKAWVVADEMQNATPAQIKMLLTRIGRGTKIVITGDVEQADRQTSENGLIDLTQRLCSRSISGLSLVSLTNRDVQRHPMITAVLDLYRC